MPRRTWRGSLHMALSRPVSAACFLSNVPSNCFKSVCKKFPVCTILSALIYIQNAMYEMWAKNIFNRKIYVHSKLSCVRSSQDLCARVHAHSLEGTLLLSQFCATWGGGQYQSPKFHMF